MTKITASVMMSIGLALALTGCGGAPMPLPGPSSSSSSSSTPEPTPTSTSPVPDEPEEVDAVLIAPRIAADCDDLISASQRASLLGVGSDEIDVLTYPLASGSAAELQAGVLTCQWTGPSLGEESYAQLDIEILPEAAVEFAAFSMPLSGTEVVGTLSAGSTINCFDYEGTRYCSVHFLAGTYWVDASFNGVIPAGKSDPISAATGFAGLISGALSSAGPVGPAFVPPAGSAAAWSSCGTLDSSAAFRAALASPALTAPEPEFTGAGTLFSEAWQRVNFKSCAWRQADPYTSPAGQIRMTTVHILPGGAWAWPSLRESYEDQGATEIAIAGADDAMLLCSSDDDCRIEALVDGSYVGFYLSVDQYRGGAAALSVTAAEFIIARL